MKTYEVVTFLKPTLSEEEIKATIAKVKKSIAESNGEFLEEKAPEKKKLTYFMKKYKDGFQYYAKFKMEEKSVNDCKGKLRVIEEIIRFMISNEVILKFKKPKVRKPKKETTATTTTPTDRPAAPRREEPAAEVQAAPETEQA
jgi:ribosomal protein S6